MKKIRYGVLGLGRMGQYHVNVATALPEVEFVAVHDAKKEKTADAASRWPVKAFDSVQELLANVDAVSICVPTPLHHLLGTQALEAGVHALIEKPLALTPQEGRDLIDLADRRGRVLHVGHVERFNGAVQELQHVVENPILWESRRLSPDPGRSHDTSVIMDLMIHDLDICLRTMRRKVVGLWAAGNGAPGKVAEVAAAGLRFEGGAMALFSASRQTQEKIRTLAVTQPGSYLVLDFTTQDLQIHRRASSATQTSSEKIRYQQEALVERVFVHKDNPLRSEILHFLKAIDSSVSDPASLRECREANEMDFDTLRIAAELESQLLAP